MDKKLQKKILMSGVLATLSFLPGCALFDRSQGTSAEGEEYSAASVAPLTGDVLVTMKGKPIITTDTLAMEKEKFLKANPQIRQALAFMPDPKEFDRNLVDGLIGQKIADEYVISHKINDTAAYKTELKDLCESMERMLNAKYFGEHLTVTVPDSEVKAFYDANKDKLRGVMTSPGGIMASGVEFNDNAAAKAFAARAKSTPGGFKKVAQDDGLNAKIKDFKLVNSQSIGIEPVLRDKIVALKTVPSIDVMEVNGKFWVVNAANKEEPKFVPYEQVKDKLKQELEQNKRVELFEKEIGKLRTDYGVEVNEDYFKGAMTQEEMPQTAEQRGGVATAAPAPAPKGVA
ncbi:MAG TPA: peptidyl-prolyl cis-trans isomerase [Candidatus Babeliales bacterium]|jgi:hypothetical protein|nr:peptidyl-prolyl cis-trans isomerase [Candidatus Babeliales bacterium]